MVTKSAPEYIAYSRSSSIWPAASFKPIGLPSDFSRRLDTKSFKSSLEFTSGIVAGEWMSIPSVLFLTFAISGVTLTPSS